MIPVKYEIKAKKDHDTEYGLVGYDPACGYRQIYVARSLAGLGRLASKPTGIKKFLHDFDFSRNFIIFITSGVQSSISWDIEIREIKYVPRKHILQLTIEEIKPGGPDAPTCICPFKIVSLSSKYYPKTVECIIPEGEPWPAEVKIE